MMRTVLLVGALILAAAPPLAAQTATMSPAQAVAAAADGGDVEGVFELHVASTGAGGFVYYLNSAADYRDAGNLAIVIQPSARNEFLAKLGGEPDAIFKGKRIRVTGVARRVPVGSHFQTRVTVDRAAQIEILG
jgi:hypothetical protein